MHCMPCWKQAEGIQKVLYYLVGRLTLQKDEATFREEVMTTIALELPWFKAQVTVLNMCTGGRLFLLC